MQPLVKEGQTVNKVRHDADKHCVVSLAVSAPLAGLVDSMFFTQPRAQLLTQ